MSISKQITLEGKTFKSIEEACRYYNLNYKKVSTRLNRKWTLEEAFEIVERKSNHKKPIVVKGKKFKSVREACRYYNIQYPIVYSRLKNNWDLELAITLPICREMDGIPVIVDNKSFISIAQACRYYNLDYDKVMKRIDKGWTIGEVFELIKKYNNPIPLILNGKKYKSISEACRYYNLNYRKITNRLRTGWSPEEAFELSERKSDYRKPLILEDKKFKSIREACKYYNLNYATVHSRIYRGWFIEEAFGIITRRTK